MGEADLQVPRVVWPAQFHVERQDQAIRGGERVLIRQDHAKAEGGWALLPLFFRRYEGKWSQDSRNPVVMLCTSKDNGPNIEDTFVVMRLETYASMLVPLVESDPSRYLRKE